MSVDYNQIANRSLERVGALSDGLFAIAMTLIVLEIRVPDLAPGRPMATSRPPSAAWALGS
jgi:uncharacterized membrane protein